jgi:hypothetical protein
MGGLSPKWGGRTQHKITCRTPPSRRLNLPPKDTQNQRTTSTCRRPQGEGGNRRGARLGSLDLMPTAPRGRLRRGTARRRGAPRRTPSPAGDAAPASDRHPGNARPQRLFLACVSPSGHGSAGSPREPPTERSPAPEVAAMGQWLPWRTMHRRPPSGSPWRRNPARCPVSSWARLKQ